MKLFEERNCLVQLWQPLDKRYPSCDYFIGNGGIIRFSDGSVHLITAAHNVFAGDIQRRLRITGGVNLFGDQIHFRRVSGRDLAEMPLKSYQAIRVLSIDQASTPLIIRGRFSRQTPFKILINPITNNGHDFDYLVVNQEQFIGPGYSGSLIFDRNRFGVVGVVTRAELNVNRLAQKGRAEILSF